MRHQCRLGLTVPGRPIDVVVLSAGGALVMDGDHDHPTSATQRGPPTDSCSPGLQRRHKRRSSNQFGSGFHRTPHCPCWDQMNCGHPRRPVGLGGCHEDDQVNWPGKPTREFQPQSKVNVPDPSTMWLNRASKEAHGSAWCNMGQRSTPTWTSTFTASAPTSIPWPALTLCCCQASQP